MSRRMTVVGVVLAILAALVSGCASLQVDVDVYKGPLAHENVIQAKQYASLAMSAKPVLEDLYRQIRQPNVAVGETLPPIDLTKSDCGISSPSVEDKFFCGIMMLYNSSGKKVPSGPACKLENKKIAASKYGDGSAGLEELTDRVNCAVAHGTQTPEDKLFLAKSIADLTDALIIFAQKVLFTVNNDMLFKGVDKDQREQFTKRTAVLQSLGNTILVHANDLQRRREHEDHIKARGASEKQAILSAFHVAPPVAFDSILKKLSAQEPAVADTQERVLAVVASVRQDVLAQAEAAKVRDARGLRSLLTLKLATLKPGADGKPIADDIAKARVALNQLATDPEFFCDQAVAGNACHDGSAIEIIDNLISSLRAQRVRALAAGDTTTAGHLMAAINAAYEQRNSLIYLRPASDYLRSVYSSSVFQDGTERVHRNMLTDWAKYYFNPFEDDESTTKEELEKMYWQNVNKVTLSGGGQTNYVLAKDDVGNWYVKAYSADPEVVFKSATSLALFNTGKSMNVNLLRRNDLQGQVDDKKNGLTSTQRAELRSELAGINHQDGAPLLKVRDRYAERYARDTGNQAGLLLERLTGLADEVRIAAVAGVPKPDPGAAPDPGACQVKTMLDSVATLDAAHLEPARARLVKLAAAVTAPAPAAADSAAAVKAAGTLTEDREKAIQAGLTSVHLFGVTVHRAIAASDAGGCEALRLDAAARAREQVRQQIIAIATERKQSVERYEDALASISEIAAAER